MKYLILLVLSVNAHAQWSTDTELSALQAGGNTISEAYNFKTKSELKKDKRSYSFGGHYTLGSANVAEPGSGEEDIQVNARNWDVFTKYEQKFSEKFSGVASIKFEGDRFAGFKQRENADLGGKYKLRDTEQTKSFVELGYRYTIERTVTRNDDNEDVLNDNKARAYYEIKHDFRKGFSVKYWVEYIYNFNRTEDYLINTEPSMSLAIDETFSLKVAYKAMYDNDPAIVGNKYLDWQYTTALLASY